MPYRKLTVVVVLAIACSGCIEGVCDWYGCDDLGGGVCVWYEGSRADVVYVDPERYAEDRCNVNSAASVVGDAKRILRADPFVIFAEHHIGFADYKPFGHGDASDPRPTGTYYWIMDKSVTGDRHRPTSPDSITIGPLDSLSFTAHVQQRGIDQALADSLLKWQPSATP